MHAEESYFPFPFLKDLMSRDGATRQEEVRSRIIGYSSMRTLKYGAYTTDVYEFDRVPSTISYLECRYDGNGNLVDIDEFGPSIKITRFR